LDLRFQTQEAQKLREGYGTHMDRNFDVNSTVFESTIFRRLETK
jgi:hypothetical protein